MELLHRTRDRALLSLSSDELPVMKLGSLNSIRRRFGSVWWQCRRKLRAVPNRLNRRLPRCGRTVVPSKFELSAFTQTQWTWEPRKPERTLDVFLRQTTTSKEARSVRR